jgi:FAD:protein FMN transferase
VKTLEFDAMGTTVRVWADRTAQMEAVQDRFAEVESVCSRFLPNSELSRCNASESDTIRVSPLLGAVLCEARAMFERTDGLVDAGLGGVICAWGYDRSFELVLDREEPPAVEGVETTWAIDGTTLFKRPGTQLDLGGIAKGWACDRAVEESRALMVGAGGDIRSIDPETVVSVEDPWGDTVADVALGVGGLATSSRARRRWVVGGSSAHHIIDPRTGAPAVSPVMSATVVAETAVDAEAGAKAVLIHGVDGLRWASERSWIRSALVVWDDGAVYGTKSVEHAPA